MTDQPSARLLAAAVARIGGAPRAGQEQMVAAVDSAIASGEHALIQAGTGTGKSLGYLAPLVAYAHANPEARLVVATATLALQSQLAGKDIPAILAAAADLGLGEINWCVLKGSANYPCLLKIRQAPIDPADQQDTLEEFDDPEPVDPGSPLGKQVVALRAWAEEQAGQSRIADRDDAPRHSGRAWAQVSISGRECVGPECPYNGDCFVQAARDRASQAQLVVTNHALVAIEAGHGWAMLDPDVLVVDEAHELAARVTTAETDELSPQLVDRVVRLTASLVTDETAAELRGAAERFADALELAEPGRVKEGGVRAAVADLRVATRHVLTALGHGDARAEQVANAVKRVYETCDRVSAADDAEVVWVSQRPQYGAQLVVAPLRVAETIRHDILDHQTTILTSATLTLGQSFTPLATTVGLAGGEEPAPYTALDVGSPFDYASQGICYVAAHLPPPGRDGIGEAQLTEIADLVEAAGGHTLGLFSSLRAAERAAEFVRATTGQTVLLQGEGHLPDLIGSFLAEPQTCLFGTLSLWQGLDAPGDTCHLVIVDRIPFPRPDEPLMQARQEDVSRRGGNGFMAVAASHAGLMLAQGTGRLIRRTTDRGVVAILDSRLKTARYGGFLITSMPPLWMTTNRTIVLEALARLKS